MTDSPYIAILAWIGGVCSFTISSLQAAEPVKRHVDFRAEEHTQVAPVTGNASFLATMLVPKVSYFEVAAQKQNGKFINASQSDDSFAYRISAGSYYQLNKRIMLYGAIDYTSFTGQNMSGSAFIQSGMTPFDIVETDDANKGRKRLESYHLQGKLGYRTTDRFRLGAAIDYTAANYAKHKDLRHKNTLMDMQVSVGANWDALSWMTVGASYNYHRNNEAVEFNTYGNKDVQYYSLISFGNYFGSREAFGDSGYTYGRTPLFTQTHGGALQLELHPAAWRFLSEVYYNSASGRFGNGSSTSVVYTHHDADEMGYRGRAVFGKEHKLLHVVDLKVSNETLKNYENSFRSSTDANNVTQIVYYGSNEVLKRNTFQADAAYTAYIGSEGGYAAWKAGAVASYFHRTTDVNVYPFYRNQTVHCINVEAFGQRNWAHRQNMYSLGVRAGYGKGGGTPKEDGLYATPGSNQKAPTSREDLLMHDYEYLTAARYTAGVDFTFEHSLSHGKMAVYAGAAYRYTQATGVDVVGKDRHVVSLNVGCKF